MDITTAKRLKRKADIIGALTSLGIKISEIKRSDGSNKPPRIQELKTALYEAITTKEQSKFVENKIESVINLKSDETANVADVINNSTKKDEKDSRDNYNDDCPICLCNDEEDMRIFECKHRIHIQCCQGLASIKCPICSKDIKTFSKKELMTIKKNKAKYSLDNILEESAELQQEENDNYNSNPFGFPTISALMMIPVVNRNDGTFAFGQELQFHYFGNVDYYF